MFDFSKNTHPIQESSRDQNVSKKHLIGNSPANTVLAGI
jgi:hypothetical protein